MKNELKRAKWFHAAEQSSREDSRQLKYPNNSSEQSDLKISKRATTFQKESTPNYEPKITKIKLEDEAVVQSRSFNTENKF